MIKEAKSNIQSKKKKKLIKKDRTWRVIIEIWEKLKLRRRIQLCVLITVMILSSLSEILSLGAIFPLLTILSNPAKIWDMEIVQYFAKNLRYEGPNELLLPLTVLFASVVIISTIIRLLNIWLSARLAAAIGTDLSCEAYSKSLNQPFEVQIERNTSEIITIIITHMGATIAAINSFLQLTASSMIAIGIIIGLLLINAKIAIITILIFGGAYGAIGKTSRRKLIHNSEKIATLSEQQLKTLKEGLGAIRDIILDRNQGSYVEIYEKADAEKRQLQAKNSFYRSYPRYAIETTGFLLIAIVSFILTSGQNEKTAIIPILGSLALGAQRLLPALQQVYVGWATIKSSHQSIWEVIYILNEPIYLPKIKETVQIFERELGNLWATPV